MEWETSRILTKVLGRRELDKVPPDTAKKIEKYFEDRFEEFLQQQAVNETKSREFRKLNTGLLFLFFDEILLLDIRLQWLLECVHMLCPKFTVVLVHCVYALQYLSAKNRLTHVK